MVLPYRIAAKAIFYPTDVRVTDIPYIQSEPAIAVNPAKPSNLVAAFNDFYPRYSSGVGYAYSTDGGGTWSTGMLSSSGLEDGYVCCDASVAFDSAGRAYIAALSGPLEHIVLYTSFPDTFGNAGAQWSNPFKIEGDYTGKCQVDRTAIAVDTTGGAHDGSIYVAYGGTLKSDCYYQGSVKLVVAYATPNGPSFLKAPIQVSSASTSLAIAPALSIGPDGSLYASYLELKQKASSWSLGVSRSDDGGASFALTDEYVSSISIPNVPYFIPPSVFTGNRGFAPTMAVTGTGTVVVAWTDNRFGDLDILSSSSTTRGKFWNAPVQVNNDKAPSTKNGKDQFIPAAAAGSSAIYIFFYDRRSDPKDVVGALWGAISTNNGLSFSNFPVSDGFSDPNICQDGSTPCLWGDNIGAAEFTGASSETYYAVWADSKDVVISKGTSDENVNIYFKSLKAPGGCPCAPWGLHQIKVNFPFPLQKCSSYPELCSGVYTQEILQFNGTAESVGLYAPQLPAGVAVAFSPQSGVTPFTSIIRVSVDPAQAFCVGSACQDNITLIANSTTTSENFTLQVMLYNQPFIVLNRLVYNSSDPITILGEGYASNTAVSLRIDGNGFGSITTDVYGNFTLSSILPDTIINGQHTLTASTASGVTASGVFHTPSSTAEPGGPPPAIPTLPAFPIPASLAFAIGIAVIALITRRRMRVHSSTEI